MKIIIGSDHGGFKLKNDLCNRLQASGYIVLDKGTFSLTLTDYPKIAYEVAVDIIREGGVGILICKTGIGMCIAANKVKGIRAAMVTTKKMAKMARQHNNSNVICLGAKLVTHVKAFDLVNVFLGTSFDNDERHMRRLESIKQIENNIPF